MNKEVKMFWFLISFSLLALFFSTMLGNAFSIPTGNVALIKIDKEIGSSDLFGGLSSDDVISLIESAEKNPNIKVIVFDINSPGGSVVSTYEIVQAVKEVKKPTIAWIRDMGTSGAYWVSSACDVIVASPFSITGSIGVIAGYLEFADLFEKYGITYVNLSIPGKKDMLSPYRHMTNEEKEEIMKVLNQTYFYFVSDVAENRNMTVEQVLNLSDEGAVMSGQEAYNRGFIDVLGGKKEVEEIAKKLGGLERVEMVTYEKKQDLSRLLSDLLFGLSRFSLKASQTPL